MHAGRVRELLEGVGVVHAVWAKSVRKSDKAAAANKLRGRLELSVDSKTLCRREDRA